MLAAIGCRGGDRLEERVLACADIAGAKASANAELVSLVARIEQQRGLPRQLTPSLGPASDNAAAAIAGLMSDELCLRLRKQVDAALAADTAATTRVALLERHARLAEHFAEAADLPNCRFDCEHRYGFFGRLRSLDDAAVTVGLFTLRAEERARRRQLNQSVADFGRALRVAHRLGHARRIEPRLLSGTLRAQVLAVAGRLFDSADWGRDEAERLYATLRDHLADWPDDRGALVGERATVMHAYEALRDGMLDGVLTLAERKAFEQQGRLDAMRSASPEAIDADQADYLRAMEAILATTETPHHERLDALESARDASRRGPLLFAEPVFLADVPDALRLAAEDRARTEAWTIALALAADLLTPPWRVNPANGVEYLADTNAASVVVRLAGEGGEAIRLPRLQR